ncbi:MAG: hypothetical protein KA233_03070 [Novosphingobium sp.]|nr:hypothetical protein [Novosphingobium sp.]
MVSQSFNMIEQEAAAFSKARQEEIERVARKNRDSHEAMWLIQDRDPCFNCGTRKDRHDEFGCGRWRAT